MFKRLAIALLLIAAIIGPGLLAPDPVEAHQTYTSVYPTSRGTQVYFPDFYVSAGATHWIQQTAPDNRICYHRIYHRSSGQLIVGVWLKGNNDPRTDYPSYFSFGHNSSTSQAFRHSVSSCVGQVQVYYWH